jgi:hypothetical protein
MTRSVAIAELAVASSEAEACALPGRTSLRRFTDPEKRVSFGPTSLRREPQ